MAETLKDWRPVKGFAPGSRFAVRQRNVCGFSESATCLADLAALNSNHLEALYGDRKGQFSIRINQQWRICFRWPKDELGPSDVEIVDYH